MFGPTPAQQVVREERQVDAAEVLVARTDIGIGQIATQASFRWQSWPNDAVSPAFISRRNGGDDLMLELAGAIARAPILAGEPITAQKLVKAGQGGVLAAILPRGMRATSTPISDKSAAGRMILPNDRVDVILIRRLQARDRSETFSSETLFENIRVLAIGQQLEIKDGRKTEAGATTATLELTPRQAELLALANSLGEITLTLRSIADLTADASGATSADPFGKPRGDKVKVLQYGAVVGVN
ncbi:MAG: Flp pilus assembly protein CpaB [Sphingomonadales bacterium]|nr:Flp pilus assembly protein CpaB [Sphingomonadales bacterium]